MTHAKLGLGSIFKEYVVIAEASRGTCSKGEVEASNLHILVITRMTTSIKAKL